MCELLAAERCKASGNDIVHVDNLLLMYGGGAEPLLKNTVLRLERGHVYGCEERSRSHLLL